MLETGSVLTSAALVGWAWQRPTHALLSWAPLVWVGTISYRVYVWHESELALAYQMGLPVMPTGRAMFAWKLGLGIGCAALTWYAFERPINRLKDRVTAPSRDRILQIV